MLRFGESVNRETLRMIAVNLSISMVERTDHSYLYSRNKNTVERLWIFSTTADREHEARPPVLVTESEKRVTQSLPDIRHY
jgi:hypothetical protein